MRLMYIINRITIYFITVVVMFYASNGSAQLSTYNVANPGALKVVIYGDELTVGNYVRPENSFAVQLERKLRTVGFNVNVEAVGENKVTLLTALQEIDGIMGKAPDVIILQIGQTDIERNYNINEYKYNMLNLIKQIKKKGIYVILIGVNAKPSAYRSELYVKLLKKLMKFISESTPVYPYMLKGIEGNERFTLGDNYHPNAYGIKYLVDNIYVMVDAGLRWRIEQINKWHQEQQLKMYQYGR
ncbi:MAG: hypothetical protein R3D71_05220 [Rickettsiales bacterium]